MFQSQNLYGEHSEASIFLHRARQDFSLQQNQLCSWPGPETSDFIASKNTGFKIPTSFSVLIADTCRMYTYCLYVYCTLSICISCIVYMYSRYVPISRDIKNMADQMPNRGGEKRTLYLKVFLPPVFSPSLHGILGALRPGLPRIRTLVGYICFLRK